MKWSRRRVRRPAFPRGFLPGKADIQVGEGDRADARAGYAGRRPARTCLVRGPLRLGRLATVCSGGRDGSIGTDLFI